VNFFDFYEDLYDQKLQVDILDRLRDEEKFNSVSELQEQLIRDRERSLDIINKS
jgi:riboflavin kinase/FMN adenylyltransferase